MAAKRTKADVPKTYCARLYCLDQQTIQEIADRLKASTGRPVSATDVVVYLCSFYRAVGPWFGQTDERIVCNGN